MAVKGRERLWLTLVVPLIAHAFSFFNELLKYSVFNGWIQPTDYLTYLTVSAWVMATGEGRE